MSPYGAKHYDRRHHAKIVKGWILWISSRSKAARRAARKRARREWKFQEI